MTLQQSNSSSRSNLLTLSSAQQDDDPDIETSQSRKYRHLVSKLIHIASKRINSNFQFNVDDPQQLCDQIERLVNGSGEDQTRQEVQSLIKEFEGVKEGHGRVRNIVEMLEEKILNQTKRNQVVTENTPKQYIQNSNSNQLSYNVNRSHLPPLPYGAKHSPKIPTIQQQSQLSLLEGEAIRKRNQFYEAKVTQIVEQLKSIKNQLSGIFSKDNRRVRQSMDMRELKDNEEVDFVLLPDGSWAPASQCSLDQNVVLSHSNLKQQNNSPDYLGQSNKDPIETLQILSKVTSAQKQQINPKIINKFSEEDQRLSSKSPQRVFNSVPRRKSQDKQNQVKSRQASPVPFDYIPFEDNLDDQQHLREQLNRRNQRHKTLKEAAQKLQNKLFLISKAKNISEIHHSPREQEKTNTLFRFSQISSNKIHNYSEKYKDLLSNHEEGYSQLSPIIPSGSLHNQACDEKSSKESSPFHMNSKQQRSIRSVQLGSQYREMQGETDKKEKLEGQLLEKEVNGALSINKLRTVSSESILKRQINLYPAATKETLLNMESVESKQDIPFHNQTDQYGVETHQRQNAKNKMVSKNKNLNSNTMISSTDSTAVPSAFYSFSNGAFRSGNQFSNNHNQNSIPTNSIQQINNGNFTNLMTTHTINQSSEYQSTKKTIPAQVSDKRISVVNLNDQKKYQRLQGRGKQSIMDSKNTSRLGMSSPLHFQYRPNKFINNSVGFFVKQQTSIGFPLERRRSSLNPPVLVLPNRGWLVPSVPNRDLYNSPSQNHRYPINMPIKSPWTQLSKISQSRHPSNPPRNVIPQKQIISYPKLTSISQTQGPTPNPTLSTFYVENNIRSNYYPKTVDSMVMGFYKKEDYQKNNPFETGEESSCLQRQNDVQNCFTRGQSRISLIRKSRSCSGKGIQVTSPKSRNEFSRERDGEKSRFQEFASIHY